MNQDTNRSPLLSVRDVSILFPGQDGPLSAVNGVSFDLYEGEVLGLVGESGSGKSVTARALIGLLPQKASVTEGEALFDGRVELLRLPDKAMQRLRGSEIGMIFQDPMSCLDPVFRVGSYLIEVLRSHDRSLSRREAEIRCADMLRSLGIREAEGVMRSYRSALSGGMCQRVMIAAALLCSPRVLIADEPTTALDVTTQEQILALLRQRQEKQGLSMLFITHDLGVVASICDRVCVMYGGRILERGSVDDIFYRPAHPYTQALLRAMPRLDDAGTVPEDALDGQPADAASLPSGCAFHPRCSQCTARCREEAPPEHALSDGGHSACCWLLKEEHVR